MNCNNITQQIIQRRYDAFLSDIKCGNTMVNGKRAICDECLNNEDKMREIERQEANIEADNAWAASAGWGEF